MTPTANDDPAAALDALLGRTMSLLSGAQPEAAGPFTGSAADGLVQCEVGADGRLASLDLDPRVLRLPVEDISAQVVAAVNQALDARPGHPDARPLVAELRAVQEQSVVEMRRITQTFTDALHRSVGGRS